jgi:Phosphate-selective porin O and P
MFQYRNDAGIPRSILSSRVVQILLIAFLLCSPAAAVSAGAEDPGAPPAGAEQRIRELERSLKSLAGQVEELHRTRGAGAPSWADRFTFGGYGELHANFGEGGAADQFDIHRLVAYVGYEFADWIRFHSEVEIEHAFVAPEDQSGGEVSIEQAYLDFLLSDRLNVRFGRFLTPIGIINRKHEPPSFNGVERPSFDTFILPTTWSSDGIGIFGSLTPAVKYEAYVAGGLDGSKFDAVDGIREGRIEERASLNDPAVMGRLEYYPFAGRAAAYGQLLRVGATAYYSGLDNGNEGNNPGIAGNIRIVSGDFEYSVSRFDVRGVIAHERIHGAEAIGNGVASEIFGWYLEGGVNVLPDAWKRGKLARADAVVFARYEDFDTQFRMPGGVAKDPAGDRTQWTAGANFYFTPSLVAKADCRFPGDGTGNHLPIRVDVGLGWQF